MTSQRCVFIIHHISPHTLDGPFFLIPTDVTVITELKYVCEIWLKTKRNKVELVMFMTHLLLMAIYSGSEIHAKIEYTDSYHDGIYRRFIKQNIGTALNYFQMYLHFMHPCESVCLHAWPLALSRCHSPRPQYDRTPRLCYRRLSMCGKAHH